MRDVVASSRVGAWGFALFLALAGCTGDIETPGEPLRIFGTSLETAFLNEPYNEPILVVGGLRPFTFELSEGELPAGLSLQGGSVIGTPTETGTFTVTVTVSDANLSKTFESVVLTVEERPPVEVRFNVPTTQVQRTITLRAEAENARALVALRTRISWDPELFELVPDSVAPARANFAVLSDPGEGELQVDFAALAQALSGSPRLFTFQLSPLRPANLELSADTEFLSEGGRHDFQREREGVPEPIALDEEGRDPTEPPPEGTDPDPTDPDPTEPDPTEPTDEGGAP